MPLGLGWCQGAAAHELAHERMVVGQLLQAPGPKQIRARVADVPEHQGITIEHGCGDRGAHAEQRGVVLGGGVNPQVDVLNGMGQGLFAALQSMEGGDRHCASDLARARTAHPVGDSKDGVREHERILVRLANLPNVAAGSRLADDEHHCVVPGSKIILVEPTASSSPSWSAVSAAIRSPLT